MSALPSLALEPWLHSPSVRTIFGLVDRAGEVGRVVGGAVRNCLMEKPVHEIDFATTLVPDELMEIAAAGGVKAIPTGIEHGTVTLVLDGRGFEVTTLREDIDTDGRHAVVRFGSDWEADARRRDFTFNALSVDASGVVRDPVGGYSDLIARRVRFIGDPDRRIREDHLRILRLFRFQAAYGEGPIDTPGLAAAMRHRDGLRALSAERINHEMGRLLLATGAGAVAHDMEDSGLLLLILGGISRASRLDTAIAVECDAKIEPSYPRRLAALSVDIAEDAERVAKRLRLSNADRLVLHECASMPETWPTPPGLDQAREAQYRAGRARSVDSLVYAAARGRGDHSDWANLLRSLESSESQEFPLTGKDALAAGIAPGPEVGALLARLEEWWIAQQFLPDRASLLDKLKQMVRH
jgi:poly(A) polymerase